MRSILVLVAVLTFVSVTYAAYSQAQILANDGAILQYALTLENIEATYYAAGQKLFTANSFTAAGYTVNDYNYFNTIAAHEAAHVSALTSFIGSGAVSACVYNFTALNGGIDPYSSVAAYVKFAGTLESTGVGAYLGVFPFIQQKKFVQAAATIVTVEARHSQYVTRLVSTPSNPPTAATFPAFDKAIDVATIAGIVGTLSNQCLTKLTSAGLVPVSTFDFPTTQFYAVFNPTTFDYNPNAVISPSVLTPNDIGILQYALFLENLEAYFYNYYISQYSAARFQQEGFSSDVFPYLQLVAQHETAHVTTLQTVISNAGVTPVTACASYQFPVTNATTFVALAAAVEPLGVSAYDGASPYITSKAYLSAAGSIATVEARHASVLALFATQIPGNAANPFPNIFDPTFTPQQVIALFVPGGTYSSFVTLNSSCIPVAAQNAVAYAQVSNATAATVAPTTTGSASTTGASTSGASTSGATTNNGGVTTATTSYRASSSTSSTTSRATNSAATPVVAIAMIVLAVVALLM